MAILYWFQPRIFGCELVNKLLPGPGSGRFEALNPEEDKMSAANLFAGVLFGAIGFAAFLYGKNQASFKLMIIGGVLMAFPYFIADTFALYAVGVLLTTALFIFRD